MGKILMNFSRVNVQLPTSDVLVRDLKETRSKRKRAELVPLFSLLFIESAVKTCFAAFIERYSVGINRRCV